MVRSRAQGAARSLKVAMTLEPKPAEQRPVAQSVTPAGSTEWAMCHQKISTVSEPSAALQRTRSLVVTRIVGERRFGQLRGVRAVREAGLREQRC